MAPLRIGIDASMISLAQGRGYRRYVLGLLKALALLDSPHQYTLFSQEVSGPGLPGGRQIKTASPRRYLPFRYWRNGGFLGALAARFQLIHFPCMDIWYSRRGKSVVTIHDLAPLSFPSVFFQNPGEEKKYHRHLKMIAEFADLIVTVSEYTAQQVIRHLNVTKERVRTVHNAVDPLFLQKTSRELSSKRSLPPSYFLFVGSLDFRKNIPLLLEAFDLYRSRGGKSKLVLIGRQDVSRPVYFPPVQKMLEGLHEKDQVLWLQDVSDGELPEIYQKTQALVFPSLFEGFGYPLVEAMSSEIPVISVRTSCLPEIAGDAALWAELNAGALSDAMRLVEEDLPLRCSLIEKGRKRAQLFSSRIMGERMVDAYESIERL